MTDVDPNAIVVTLARARSGRGRGDVGAGLRRGRHVDGTHRRRACRRVASLRAWLDVHLEPEPGAARRGPRPPRCGAGVEAAVAPMVAAGRRRVHGRDAAPRERRAPRPAAGRRLGARPRPHAGPGSRTRPGIRGGWQSPSWWRVPAAARLEVSTGFQDANGLLGYLGRWRGRVRGPGGEVARRRASHAGWPLVGTITEAPLLAVAVATSSCCSGSPRSDWQRRRPARRCCPGRRGGVVLPALALTAPTLLTSIPGLPNDHYHVYLDPAVLVLCAAGLAAIAGCAAGHRDSWSSGNGRVRRCRGGSRRSRARGAGRDRGLALARRPPRTAGGRSPTRPLPGSSRARHRVDDARQPAGGQVPRRDPLPARAPGARPCPAAERSPAA